MSSFVSVNTPPEIEAALQSGKRAGTGIRGYCPNCDPDRRHRDGGTLWAGILSAGPHRGKASWCCHRCHCEKDYAAARKTASVKWEIDRTKLKGDEARMRAYALEIIEAATFIREGDPLDRHLRLARGLEPQGPCWPTDLRVASRHKGHRRHPATKKECGPVMIGVVRGPGGDPIAAHRTYLYETSDGRVVKISDEAVPRQFRHPNAKFSLGSVAGGAIRLGIDSDEIGVAEGIESALGLAMGTGLVCWSALSAGNMAAVRIPKNVKRLVIGPDLGDKRDVGLESAYALHRRARESGIEVSILMPPIGSSDWGERHR